MFICLFIHCVLFHLAYYDATAAIAATLLRHGLSLASRLLVQSLLK